MIAFLRDNPLLLLFLVAGLGFVLGKVRVAGVSLGVAAVLFAGLAFGALHPSVALPELVPLLGLVLFVYTVGLGSGPGFFSSLGGRGLRDNGVALLIILVISAMTVALGKLLHLHGAQAAGLLAGSATNTPALAAVLDALRARGEATSEPVVMYSIAYPMGVLFVLVAILVMRRLLPPDAGPPSRRTGGGGIDDVTVSIEHEEAIGRTIAELRERTGLHVTFGRVRHSGVVKVAHDDARLQRGDLLTVVGKRDDLERAIELLGSRSRERIDLDRKSVDYRRIFVSEPSVTRRPLRELAVAQHYEAVITRVRRGDVELLPDANPSSSSALARGRPARPRSTP